jgi:hypothetical protein
VNAAAPRAATRSIDGGAAMAALDTLKRETA